jgi:2-oxoglutarate ferredoxin oxidoreductase subunit alpha
VQSVQPRAELGREQIALTFGKKDRRSSRSTGLARCGFAWAESNLDFKYRIPAVRATEAQIVVNGNTALALGVLASGMDICAMYPITPATSVSHYLSDVFERSAASSTRRRTRSPPARSRSALPMRASAR